MFCLFPFQLLCQCIFLSDVNGYTDVFDCLLHKLSPLCCSLHNGGGYGVLAEDSSCECFLLVHLIYMYYIVVLN